MQEGKPQNGAAAAGTNPPDYTLKISVNPATLAIRCEVDPPSIIVALAVLKLADKFYDNALQPQAMPAPPAIDTNIPPGIGKLFRSKQGN